MNVEIAKVNSDLEKTVYNFQILIPILYKNTNIIKGNKFNLEIIIFVNILKRQFAHDLKNVSIQKCRIYYR